jgi:hypothetical protein
MANMKVKKTWVSIGEKENLIELCRRCENEEFVMFVKEHSQQCFHPIYFQHFGWIKMRFDDLKYDFENDNDPLLNARTYEDHCNEEEEDILDFSDWDLKNGCKFGSKPKSQFIKQSEQSNTKFTNQKVSPSKVIEIEHLKKDLLLFVKSYEEVPIAMKCILWSLKNEPQTTYALYSNIQFIDGDIKRKFTSDEYKNILNPIIDRAVKDKILDLKIIPKDNKKVYLYSNPSNKRIGYFYEGKLCSVKELSINSGINENTLYSRLLKSDIYKAMTGV